MSKYFIGNLFIFIAKSLRNLYVNFCDTDVIVNPCINENSALIIYNIKSVSIIPAILEKSIPSPPDTLPTNPLKISVVAFPSILGPTIANIVLPIANIITIAS